MIVVNEPIIRTEGGKTALIFQLSKNKLENDIEIKVPNQYEEFLSTSSDSILIGTLFSAMATGDDILIKGSLSRELLMSFRGPMQTLLKLNKPSLKSINIYHEGGFEESETKGDYIATGFSGGVDSLCTIYDYYIDCDHNDFKITHLLHNSLERWADKKIDVERPDLVTSAKKLGIPLIEVDTNLSLLYTQPWTHQEYRALHVDTLWHTSLAAALKTGLKKYYFSSSFSYQYLHFNPDEFISKINPELTRLIQLNNLKVTDVGSEYTRVEKTERIAELDLAWKHLNVCLRSSIEGKKNCGICMKCKRTLITLELIGKTDNFSDVFDLNEWSKVKNEYFWSIKLQKEPFSKEIQEKFEELNFKRSISGLPSAAYNYYLRQAKDKVKKVLS